MNIKSIFDNYLGFLICRDLQNLWERRHVVARVALHTHSYKKTIKSYTSFPISFGCDDDEEQRSSVGDNGLEGDELK